MLQSSSMKLSQVVTPTIFKTAPVAGASRELTMCRETDKDALIEEAGLTRTHCDRKGIVSILLVCIQGALRWLVLGAFVC